MSRWIWLGLFTVALWAGAFGISLLVVEWRTADDVRGLEADVAEIISRLDSISTEQPTSKPTAEVTPTQAPEEMVVRAEVGAVVEWRGMRLTIEDIRREEPPAGLRYAFTITFVVENIDASPETTAGLDYKAVDDAGFTCVSTNGFYAGQKGEKVRTEGVFGCDSGLKTLLLDGIRFEFP